MALVATLAILALAAALLAGAFATASASARATRSLRASLVADALVRRVLASALVQWSGAEEALLIGGTLIRAVPDSITAPVDAADARIVVMRLSAKLHVIAADVTVPAIGTPLARRRARVIVTQHIPIDTTRIQSPTIISRWGVGPLL